LKKLRALLPLLLPMPELAMTVEEFVDATREPDPDDEFWEDEEEILSKKRKRENVLIPDQSSPKRLRANGDEFQLKGVPEELGKAVTAKEEENKQPPKPKCEKCSSISLHRKYWETYKVPVCFRCSKFSEYDQVTKTTAKMHYLLKDEDIADMGFIERDVKKEKLDGGTWARKMKLYLKRQVVAKSMEKFGTDEKLGEERTKRAVASLERSIKRQRKAKEDEVFWWEESLDQEQEKAFEQHTKIEVCKHSFGNSSASDSTGMTSRTCTKCGERESFFEF